MTVRKLFGKSGFLEHAEFPDNVFFSLPDCFGNLHVSIGDHVEVDVSIGLDTKTGTQSYIAMQGILLSAQRSVS